jgi:hypothetical protein
MVSTNENEYQQVSYLDKALILGLKLASSGLVGLSSCLTLVVLQAGGLVLALVCLLVSWIQSADFLELFNYSSLYILFPCSLLIAGAWFSYLLSRVLWCAVRKPITAKLLAVLSTVARLAVVFAFFYGWSSGKSFSDILLLPNTIACAAIAWLGLASDWFFVRILHCHLVPSKERRELNENTDLDVNSTLNESNKRTFFSGLKKREEILFWIIAIIGFAVLVYDKRLAFARTIVIAPMILQLLPQFKTSLVDEIIESMTSPLPKSIIGFHSLPSSPRKSD